MNKQQMQDSYDMAIAMLTTQAETEGLLRQDMEDFLRCVMLAMKFRLQVSNKHQSMSVAVGTMLLAGVPGPVLFMPEEPEDRKLH